MYMEVCQRLGMPMSAALLEGRHCLLWPSRVPLRAGEEDVVVDAYSNGEIYLLKEVHAFPPTLLCPPDLDGDLSSQTHKCI